MEKGTVYWITGLAGAGKTSIGQLIYNKIKVFKKNIVFLDGDILRNTLAEDLGYSQEERIKVANRYSRLSYMLSEQNIDVVISTISMFNCIRQWNRENICNYKEIYLKVPFDILAERNQKNLYLNKSTKNVVGIDIEIEEPINPDIIIYNDGRYTLDKCVNIIMKTLVKN